jgi:hypothetical protein
MHDAPIAALEQELHDANTLLLIPSWSFMQPMTAPSVVAVHQEPGQS